LLLTAVAAAQTKPAPAPVKDVKETFFGVTVRYPTRTACAPSSCRQARRTSPEFGTVKDPDGFKGLLEMSSYRHVRDGVKYPAVLLIAGINDPRVESWQAGKMTARLQAAPAGDRPILLRIDYDAGHGFGCDQEVAVRGARGYVGVPVLAARRKGLPAGLAARRRSASIAGRGRFLGRKR
jgi:hypothetical protein